MTTVLAIETSCDETAVAVVNDRQILSNVICSQIDVHASWGGVVPEVAAREHVEAINYAIAQAYQEAHQNWQISWSEIDGVAVTVAPGLIGALLVGVTAAKTLAMLHSKPLVGVHHLEGHICSAFLADPSLEPPFLCLLVSGGHSSLILVKDYGSYQVMGKTRDDAAGEAFDKVARLLKLGYPGGPAIERAAQGGDFKAFNLPQGRIEDAPFDFSFSGLKTAVLRLTEKIKTESIKTERIKTERNKIGEVQTDLGENLLEDSLDYLPIADIAASFQYTIAQTLATRSIKCALAHQIQTLVVVGGVAANSNLRSLLQKLATQNQIKVIFPPLKLCTDNAAMIGCAGAIHLSRGETSGLDLACTAKLDIQDCQSLYANSNLS